MLVKLGTYTIMSLYRSSLLLMKEANMGENQTRLAQQVSCSQCTDSSFYSTPVQLESTCQTLAALTRT